MYMPFIHLMKNLVVLGILWRIVKKRERHRENQRNISSTARKVIAKDGEGGRGGERERGGGMICSMISEVCKA